MQFGVFGPILLVVLLRTAWREIRRPSDQGKVLAALLLAADTRASSRSGVAFPARTAIGSATAYPAGSILVTAVMLELNRQVLFRVSLGLHLAFAAAVAAAPAFAPQWRLFEQLQFLSRVVGWRESADIVRTKLSEQHYGSILVDTREMAGELLYYLRDGPIPLYVWPAGPTPKDHYEMTRPFTAASPEPSSIVSLRRCPERLREVVRRRSRISESQRVRLVEAKSRMLHFCRLADYKGPRARAPNAPAQ